MQDLLSEVSLTAASEWSAVEPLLQDDPRFDALAPGERRRLFESAVGNLWKRAAEQGGPYSHMSRLKGRGRAFEP